MRIVPMRIKLSYKRPDQVHFESVDGFAFLPREGIMPWSEELESSLRQHAKMVMAGETTIYGQTAYLIEVALKSGMIPKPNITTKPRAYRQLKPAAPTQASAPTMRVWVERERWLIRKMETRSGPAYGEVRFDYQQVSGKYWLPKRVVAKVKWTGQPMSANLPRQRKNMRMPSRATVIFDFSNYRVNVGLPASLFRKETPTPTLPVHPGHDPDEPR